MSIVYPHLSTKQLKPETVLQWRVSVHTASIHTASIHFSVLRNKNRLFLLTKCLILLRFTGFNWLRIVMTTARERHTSLLIFPSIDGASSKRLDWSAVPHYAKPGAVCTEAIVQRVGISCLFQYQKLSNLEWIVIDEILFRRGSLGRYWSFCLWVSAPDIWFCFTFLSGNLGSQNRPLK